MLLFVIARPSQSSDPAALLGLGPQIALLSTDGHATIGGFKKYEEELQLYLEGTIRFHGLWYAANHLEILDYLDYA